MERKRLLKSIGCVLFLFVIILIVVYYLAWCAAGEEKKAVDYFIAFVVLPGSLVGACIYWKSILKEDYLLNLNFFEGCHPWHLLLISLVIICNGVLFTHFLSNKQIFCFTAIVFIVSLLEYLGIGFLALCVQAKNLPNVLIKANEEGARNAKENKDDPFISEHRQLLLDYYRESENRKIAE